MKETVPRALDGERVDRVVAFLTGLPRREVADLVAAGAVRLGGSTVDTRARKVVEGDVVEVDVPPPADDRPEADASVDFPVVHADQHVIVVDKPPGLVVHPGAGQPGGTLVHGLLHRFPDLAGVGEPTRPGIVHRLDKGTSGLMVVARTPAALADLSAQLKARTVERRYLALVLGEVAAGSGVVDAPVGRSARQPTRMAVTNRGRPARTRYEVLGRYTEPVPATLLECRLETGRTHQVRVHLAAIGHPVVGDTRYGRGQALAMNRPFLHAHSLAFDHPGDGTRRRFESPLPADLESVREHLL
ncbi:MAG: pseudouridine synthase, RluA family [Acidimicrobiales bacterium]|nr:pseudouridine synthase, RluA family [Acidimicrobiales bacterium]